MNTEPDSVSQHNLSPLEVAAASKWDQPRLCVEGRKVYDTLPLLGLKMHWHVVTPNEILGPRSLSQSVMFQKSHDAWMYEFSVLVECISIMDETSVSKTTTKSFLAESLPSPNCPSNV